MAYTLDDIVDLFNNNMISVGMAKHMVQPFDIAWDDIDFTKKSYTRPLVPPKCDCGGAKVKTTHSHWCSVRSK